MKNTKNKSCRSYLLMVFNTLSMLTEQDACGDENFEQEEYLIGELENNLPFKDEEEHQHWLDVLFTYKFWEDFEELTLNIIERLPKTLSQIPNNNEN